MNSVANYKIFYPMTIVYLAVLDVFYKRKKEKKNLISSMKSIFVSYEICIIVRIKISHFDVNRLETFYLGKPVFFVIKIT